MRTVKRGRLPLRAGQGIRRGEEVEVLLDGRPVKAYRGESVAAVLIVEDGLTARWTAGGSPRGVYCGMGVCYECLVVVNGLPNTRACMTLVAPGMTIERQAGSAPAR